ncbi:hypothetical protein N9K20_01330 [Methylophilaceae bacterium]|nr:hypothetical protein [Methylophilaceae bacterium]
MSKAIDDAAKIAVKGKSLVVSVLLTIFFGSLGLLYATIGGGLFMTIGYPLIALLIVQSAPTITILMVVFWYMICIIWGIIAVNRYNRNLIN